MRRSMSLVVTAFAAMLALSGCSALDSYFGSDVDVSELELTVGECVVDEGLTSDTLTEVGALPVVDCAEPHHAEVYYAETLSVEEYPDTVATTTEESCLAEFEGYVGAAYEDSRYYVSVIYPSEYTWGEGDRQVACLVTGDTDEELTGSVRGSGE